MFFLSKIAKRTHTGANPILHFVPALPVESPIQQQASNNSRRSPFYAKKQLNLEITIRSRWLIISSLLRYTRWQFICSLFLFLESCYLSEYIHGLLFIQGKVLFWIWHVPILFPRTLLLPGYLLLFLIETALVRINQLISDIIGL